MTEFFVFIGFVITIMLLIQIKSGLNGKIDEMNTKLNALLLKEPYLKNQPVKETGPVKAEPGFPLETFSAPVLPVPEIIEEEKTPPVEAVEPAPLFKEKLFIPEYKDISYKSHQQLHTKEPVAMQEPVKVEDKPTFWERNPDLEKFIGENLFNKIGIAILVLGMGFFLKYAIDQNWINEIGRTFIGIICGGILISIAHRMRKSYAAFSSVLIGGGVAILYFTITIAFQQYHLFSQGLTFAILILVTGFTILLSIAYNRMELAILAILGGFSSPLMISAGEGNYIVLFSYILLLNTGMLVLAYFKKWNPLNIICYIFTIVLFGSWLTTKVINVPNAPYAGALFFATIFYFVFFLMNIINNIKEKIPFKAIEICILISNTFIYFSVGMLVLPYIQQGAFKGLFTALLAVFNFAFAYALYKNEKTDKNLIYLLIGLVLTFLSLIAPIQLQGNYITLFWAAEAVLLLWLSQKSGISLMKKASVLIMALMLGSLIMDWFNIYGDHSQVLLYPILNKGFVTTLLAIAGVFLFVKFLQKEEEDTQVLQLQVKNYKALLPLICILLIYTGCLLELSHQAGNYFLNAKTLSIGIYNYLFLAILSAIALKRSKPGFITTVLALNGVCLISFLLFYNHEIINIRASHLYENAPIGTFLIHYILTVLFLAVLFLSYKLVKRLNKESLLRVFQWVAAFCVCVYSKCRAGSCSGYIPIFIRKYSRLYP